MTDSASTTSMHFIVVTLIAVSVGVDHTPYNIYCGIAETRASLDYNITFAVPQRPYSRTTSADKRWTHCSGLIRVTTTPTIAALSIAYPRMRTSHKFAAISIQMDAYRALTVHVCNVSSVTSINKSGAYDSLGGLSGFISTAPYPTYLFSLAQFRLLSVLPVCCLTLVRGDRPRCFRQGRAGVISVEKSLATYCAFPSVECVCLSVTEMLI